MTRWLIVAVVIISAVMFPYSARRIQRLGYDFPIYWNAGQGRISDSYEDGAYVYSHRTAPIFRPFGRLPLVPAFGAFYALSVAAYCRLLVRLVRGWSDHRVLLVGTIAVSGGAMFVALRCGNVAGLLALACTTPLGSVLAGCCKPYLFAFTVVHAAIFCARHSARAPGEVPVGEG